MGSTFAPWTIIIMVVAVIGILCVLVGAVSYRKGFRLTKQGFTRRLNPSTQQPDTIEMNIFMYIQCIHLIHRIYILH